MFFRAQLSIRMPSGDNARPRWNDGQVTVCDPEYVY